MPRYEARFRPSDEDEDVVVGYLLFDDAGRDAFPEIEPADAPDWMFMTLRHLVRISDARSADRLRGVPSGAWSFIEVDVRPS